jgi:hypothetical protein
MSRGEGRGLTARLRRNATNRTPAIPWRKVISSAQHGHQGHRGARGRAGDRAVAHALGGQTRHRARHDGERPSSPRWSTSSPPASRSPSCRARWRVWPPRACATGNRRCPVGRVATQPRRQASSLSSRASTRSVKIRALDGASGHRGRALPRDLRPGPARPDDPGAPAGPGALGGQTRHRARHDGERDAGGDEVDHRGELGRVLGLVRQPAPEMPHARIFTDLVLAREERDEA